MDHDEIRSNAVSPMYTAMRTRRARSGTMSEALHWWMLLEYSTAGRAFVRVRVIMGQESATRPDIH
jgi:hypothetical protein